MPDWTYLPVRPLAARVLGDVRAARLALASAAALARPYLCASTAPQVSTVDLVRPPTYAPVLQRANVG